MPKENTKILFVQTFRKSLIKNASQSSFIRNDRDILRMHFDVKVVQYQGKKKMFKFLIETIKGVLWSDVTFSCFADVHAFVAVLFLSKIFKLRCKK